MVKKIFLLRSIAYDILERDKSLRKIICL